MLMVCGKSSIHRAVLFAKQATMRNRGAMAGSNMHGAASAQEAGHDQPVDTVVKRADDVQRSDMLQTPVCWQHCCRSVR